MYSIMYVYKYMRLPRGFSEEYRTCALTQHLTFPSYWQTTHYPGSVDSPSSDAAGQLQRGYDSSRW